MPPDGADYTGKVATVSGWGRLKYGGGVPSVLQEVNVSVFFIFNLIFIKMEKECKTHGFDYCRALKYFYYCRFIYVFK
jgi:hypothetical protein